METSVVRRVFYVILFLVSIFIVWQVSNHLQGQRIDELEQDSYDQLQQLTDVIESSLSTYQHIPTLLASNDQVLRMLRANSRNSFNTHDASAAGNAVDSLEYVDSIYQLNLTLEQINRITEASDSYIIDRNGVTVAASNYNTSTSFIGQDFSYRPYFQQALLGESGRYYALGTTTNRRGYYFSYPVIEHDQILGVAVVKIELQQLEARLKNAKYDFLMLDPDGIIFSSSQAQWIYSTLQPLPLTVKEKVLNSQRYRNQVVEVLPFSSQKKHSNTANIIQLREMSAVSHTTTNNVAVRKEDKARIGEIVSYLHIGEPVDALGFRVDLFVPLAEIQSDTFLLRTIFIGLVMIAALVLFSVKLRQKMLRERAKAQAISLHNQAYIQEIVNNTQAGLVTLDERQQIESYNPAVERLAACPLANLIGQPLEILFSVIDDGEERALLHSEIVDLDVMACEGYLHVNPNHKVAVEMTLCRMALPNELKYLVTFHDMTERKRYEQEIILAQTALEQRVKERTSELEQANHKLRDEIDQHQDTQQELIQTAKLAVLGQLSAGINHELNQPLTAMRSFAENALKFIQRNNIKQTASNLQQIVQLSSHMRDIIARFKVFARKGSFNHSPILIETAIKGALNIMLPRLKAADVAFVLPTLKGHMVLGDLVLLEQVLVNLIANAIDAIEGEKLADTSEPSKAFEWNKKRQRIEIALTLYNDELLQLDVIDSGHGLEQSVLDHIFEPFYSSKKMGVGLGLGLSISQRIVESMGGEIYAKNHVDNNPYGHDQDRHVANKKGAVFSVRLKRFIPNELVVSSDIEHNA